MFSIIIAAFRVELFSASIVDSLNNGAPDRDLPLQLCFFFDEDDDIYGDRICNNALAGSIISILVAMVLFLIDLQVPCVSKSASVCDTNMVANVIIAIDIASYVAMYSRCFPQH